MNEPSFVSFRPSLADHASSSARGPRPGPVCPQCKATDFEETDEGYLVCIECGFRLQGVVEERNEVNPTDIQGHKRVKVPPKPAEARAEADEATDADAATDRAVPTALVFEAFQRLLAALLEQLIVRCGLDVKALKALTLTVGKLWFRVYRRFPAAARDAEPKLLAAPRLPRFDGSHRSIALGPTLALSLCHLGCLRLRLPVLSHDLVRWCENGLLPLRTFHTTLPERLQVVARVFPRMLTSLTAAGAPRGKDVSRVSAALSVGLNLWLVPPPRDAFLARLAAQLGLPRGVEAAAAKALSVWRWRANRRESRQGGKRRRAADAEAGAAASQMPPPPPPARPSASGDGPAEDRGDDLSAPDSEPDSESDSSSYSSYSSSAAAAAATAAAATTTSTFSSAFSSSAATASSATAAASATSAHTGGSGPAEERNPYRDFNSSDDEAEARAEAEASGEDAPQRGRGREVINEALRRWGQAGAAIVVAVKLSYEMHLPLCAPVPELVPRTLNPVASSSATTASSSAASSEAQPPSWADIESRLASILMIDLALFAPEPPPAPAAPPSTAASSSAAGPASLLLSGAIAMPAVRAAGSKAKGKAKAAVPASAAAAASSSSTAAASSATSQGAASSAASSSADRTPGSHGMPVGRSPYPTSPQEAVLMHPSRLKSYLQFVKTHVLPREPGRAELREEAANFELLADQLDLEAERAAARAAPKVRVGSAAVRHSPRVAARRSGAPPPVENLPPPATASPAAAAALPYYYMVLDPSTSRPLLNDLSDLSELCPVLKDEGLDRADLSQLRSALSRSLESEQEQEQEQEQLFPVIGSAGAAELSRPRLLELPQLPPRYALLLRGLAAAISASTGDEDDPLALQQSVESCEQQLLSKHHAGERPLPSEPFPLRPACAHCGGRPGARRMLCAAAAHADARPAYLDWARADAVVWPPAGSDVSSDDEDLLPASRTSAPRGAVYLSECFCDEPALICEECARAGVTPGVVPLALGSDACVCDACHLHFWWSSAEGSGAPAHLGTRDGQRKRRAARDAAPGRHGGKAAEPEAEAAGSSEMQGCEPSPEGWSYDGWSSWCPAVAAVGRDGKNRGRPVLESRGRRLSYDEVVALQRARRVEVSRPELQPGGPRSWSREPAWLLPGGEGLGPGWVRLAPPPRAKYGDLASEGELFMGPSGELAPNLRDALRRARAISEATARARDEARAARAAARAAAAQAELDTQSGPQPVAPGTRSSGVAALSDAPVGGAGPPPPPPFRPPFSPKPSPLGDPLGQWDAGPALERDKAAGGEAGGPSSEAGGGAAGSALTTALSRPAASADCGKCKACLDKKKFGGPGKLKQPCSRKRAEPAALARANWRDPAFLGSAKADEPSLGPGWAAESVARPDHAEVGRKAPRREHKRSRWTGPDGEAYLGRAAAQAAAAPLLETHAPRLRTRDVAGAAAAGGAAAAVAGEQEAAEEVQATRQARRVEVREARGPWTALEDSQLEASVARHGEPSDMADSNCGECSACLDLVRFGGTGKLKKLCVERVASARPADREWALIAEAVPGRAPKRCAERWRNVLHPSTRALRHLIPDLNLNVPRSRRAPPSSGSHSADVKTGEWSAEEDGVLIRGVQELGESSWAAIAKRLPGRNGVTVRNRWRSREFKPRREELEEAAAARAAQPGGMPGGPAAEADAVDELE